MRLTQALIGPVRNKLLADQGHCCLLCGREVEREQAVLDHDHVTGHVRGVLHRGCNAMLGHLENNRPRHMLKDDDKFGAFLSNVLSYINGDYSQNPQYPTHKTEAEKALAARERQRKKKLKEAIAANPEQEAALKARAAALRAVRANRNRPKVKGSEDA